MSSDFDDIQGILASIFEEPAKPEPVAAPVVITPPTPVAEPEDDVFLDLSDFMEPQAPTPPQRIDAALKLTPARVNVSTAPLPQIAMDDVAGSLIAAVMADVPTATPLVVPANAVIETAETAFTDSDEQSAIKIPMPVFTSAEMMKSFDMRNFASLCTLKTARWHAKVKDRQAARNAGLATGAAEEAFEARKHLLVGADELLRAIHQIIDAARLKHYSMTLPWSTTTMEDTGRRAGGRVLMNTLFFEYTQIMAHYRADMTRALGEFVPAYPSLIQRAQAKLKGSFDPREYPSVDTIQRHFDLSFDFQPIPMGDDFKGLPQQQLDKLAQHLNQQTRDMVENAMQENWMRMHKVVSAMHERLSQPDARFHGTLVENVRETVKMAKQLNMTQDVRLETMRVYAEKHLCVHDAEALKKNPVLRTTVAAHAHSMLDMMERAARV